MALKLFSEKKRTAVLNKWMELIIATYPAETAKFLNSQKDNFLNPVGSTLAQEISALFEELINEMNEQKLKVSLDKIIRIRAVQEFTPSQAINIIPLLKSIVREELSSELKENGNLRELNELEFRIDRLTLISFDIYMACREKIFEIRIRELAAQRESALSMLAMANEEYDKESEVA